jgi:hypothetical protein
VLAQRRHSRREILASLTDGDVLAPHVAARLRQREDQYQSAAPRPAFSCGCHEGGISSAAPSSPLRCSTDLLDVVAALCQPTQVAGC